MRFLAWSSVVGLLWVVGCGKPASSGAGPATQASIPSTSTEPTKVDATNPATPSDLSKPTDPGQDQSAETVQKIKEINNQGAKAQPIDKPGTNAWHPSPLTPVALAKSVDNAFYHLQGGEASIQVHYLMPIGQGYTMGWGKFPEDAKFSVKYPVIEGDPPHPQLVEVRGDKGVSVMIHPGGGKGTEAFSPVRSFQPGGSLNGDDVLSRWPEDMPRLSMSHFITGKDVYVPLISALTSPGSGFKVTSEERVLSVKGQTIKDYRVLAQRKASGSAKAETIEIVVDGRKFVPVTMIATVTPTSGKPSTIEWSGVWKGGKFNPKDFKIPN